MLVTLAVMIALTAAPTPTPPPTITHERVSSLCAGLRQNVGPAIGKVLQNDKLIASSRPLFKKYTKAISKASKDLAVANLERLIGPMVKNSEAIDKLLNDPYVFPRNATTNADEQLLQIQANLKAVAEQQQRALDIISGFVDTEQLGQLQAAGHEYDTAIGSNQSLVPTQNTPHSGGPTPEPSEVLNAGVNTPLRGSDPNLQTTGSLLGHNPLDIFEQTIADYQQQLTQSEGTAASLVMHAVALCGGRVPVNPSPSPQP